MASDPRATRMPRARESRRFVAAGELLEDRLLLSAEATGELQVPVASLLSRESLPSSAGLTVGRGNVADDGSRTATFSRAGSPSPTGLTPQQVRAAYGID